MTLNEMNAAILSARPDLTLTERHEEGAVTGYAYWFELPSGAKKRVIRISANATTGQFSLVRAAAKRAGDDAEERFFGSVEALLQIIDEQIDRIRKFEDSEAGRAAQPQRTTPSRKPSAPPPSATDVAPGVVRKLLTAEFDANGVDETQGLVYRWQIFDGAGALVGVYVGLTADGAGRRGRYFSRVEDYLAGKPYSASDPSKTYRRVHAALAEAVVKGHRVVHTYLCNGAPGERLADLEHAHIRSNDSYGPHPHQLNDKP